MNSDIFVLVEHIRGHVEDISYVLLAAARELAGDSDGSVVALLLGHDSQELADDLAADSVMNVNHPALEDFIPEVYLQVLTPLVSDNSPRAVLFGHTTVGMDLAGRLSVRLGLPLVSQCQRVFAIDGDLRFVSQICAGRIMAEGDLPEPSALISMVPGGYKPEQGRSDQKPEMIQVEANSLEQDRVRLVEFIEPETGDVDISKEPILIAIGRGLQNQDDLELVDALAEALGASICASRPIIDKCWLPSTRLVGKSGKTVKPSLYLALGISGAPEHSQAITDSEMIIAVNTDSNAPIFDIAQYGIEADMLDVLAAMTEQLQPARVG
jgi:electron transfer flavoprotein alpha subunit